jgi:phosphatidylinositol alpha-mannosyltransferase
LGRLVERKGAASLLKAVAVLAHNLQESDWRLLIAGDGPQRAKLEQQAVKLGIGGHTTFLGRIDEADKADVLASADLAIFPALSGESFGIVLIEAMAAGAGVVVGGDNPGYRSVLGAWPETLVDPQPAAAAGFARQLQHLLHNDALRQRLHAEQAKAVRQYDVTAVGIKLLRYYHAA